MPAPADNNGLAFLPFGKLAGFFLVFFNEEACRLRKSTELSEIAPLYASAMEFL